MPYLMRYPRLIEAGTVDENMILNIDFPATFLDIAGLPIPEHFQGRSFREILAGVTPPKLA